MYTKKQRFKSQQQMHVFARLIKVQHTMTKSVQFHQIPPVSRAGILLGLLLNVMVSVWLEKPCKQQTKKQISHFIAKGPKKKQQQQKSLVWFQNAAHSHINLLLLILIDLSKRKPLNTSLKG